MENQTEEKQKLIEMIEDKRKILMNLENKSYQCRNELYKNKDYILYCEFAPKIDTKKHGKFIKNLEKAEQELQELRDLIIKQNELKKVSPAEFEDVFEQTKIQMNIRKTDLKKKIKDLKIKIKYCEDEPQRNLEYLSSANECLEKKITELDLSIKETEEEINALQLQLMTIHREEIKEQEAQYKRIRTEERRKSMTDSKIENLVRNFKTLSESDQNELIGEINNIVYGNTTTGNIDLKDAIEFLQYKGNCFYKNIEISVENIESQLEEKLTKNLINAEGIFIIVEGSDEMELNQVYGVAEFINSIIAEETNVIFSAVVDDKNPDDKIKVTIFATGINE